MPTAEEISKKRRKDILERKRTRIREAAEATEKKEAARRPTDPVLLGREDAAAIERNRAARLGLPAPEISPEGIIAPIETPEEIAVAAEIREGPGLEAQFEEAGVFKEPEIVPIISPEQENLGVILRIAEDVIPGLKTLKDFSKRFDLKEAIPQAEITMIAEDIKEGIIAETSVEIDIRIDETETQLTEMGLAVFPIVGAAVVGGIVAGPTREFVGTDGQIASLELALSQYNEMITIPARSIQSGLPPEIAFEKLDRMEEGILALESQLKISALTSVKVGLALRGRGVEARILKLKEKLQESRRIVALRMTQEAFGEVDVPRSMAFLRQLQNERKGI